MITITTEEEVDGALALLWLLSAAGLSIEKIPGGDNLSITGMSDAPKKETISLLRPYKRALLEWVRVRDWGKVNRRVCQEIDVLLGE